MSTGIFERRLIFKLMPYYCESNEARESYLVRFAYIWQSNL